MTPIKGTHELVEYLERGCVEQGDERVGIEHERLLCRRENLRPAAYHGERGVAEALQRLTAYGWRPTDARGPLLELSRGDEKVSLEPAGQIEHATSPHADLHALYRDMSAHRRELDEVAGELGLAIRESGFEPLHPRTAMDWIPQQRFRIMRDYMPRVGSHGLDMMQRTCSIQASFDFTSEADMVAKMRVATALQPLLIAWCANSRYAAGRDAGRACYRSHVWQHTDDARCGLPAFVFETGMGFERYVDWALDVPMYSIVRDGEHIDATGVRFRDFLRGRSRKLARYGPTLEDWEIHLPTLTPEVRLKRVIEIRGPDSGPLSKALAIAALQTGLLYDDAARDAAWDRLRSCTHRARIQAYRDASRSGLAATMRGRRLAELAVGMLVLAQEGLARRARSSDVHDESGFLLPLARIVCGNGIIDRRVD